MSGPGNGPFLGELYDHVFGPFLDLMGVRFFGAPEKIFGPEGVRKCRFWPFLAIFGGFRDPPKIRKFPEIFPPVSLQSGGAKSAATPFLKSWRPSNATENRANFDFCANLSFFAIFGPFLGHFWPFLAIFHILDLGGVPPILGGEKKNPV